MYIESGSGKRLFWRLPKLNIIIHGTHIDTILIVIPDRYFFTSTSEMKELWPNEHIILDYFFLLLLNDFCVLNLYTSIHVYTHCDHVTKT